LRKLESEDEARKGEMRGKKKGTTSENVLIVGMEGTRSFEIDVDVKKTISKTMSSEYSDGVFPSKKQSQGIQHIAIVDVYSQLA
jgi:hypothetical protein